MKALVVMTALLAASISFAKVDLDSLSWGEILKSGSQYTTSDDIIFQNGPGLGATWKESTSRDMCHDGTYIYGGSTIVTVCDGEGEGNCEKINVNLMTKINGTKTVCTEFSGRDDSNCVGGYVSVPFQQSPHRSVTVLKRTNGDNNVDKRLGKKSYSIPFCGDLTPVPAN